MEIRWTIVIVLVVFCSTTRSEKDAKPSVIEFANIEKAREEIVDESIEPYFQLLQPAEMWAKTGSPISGDTLEEQRQECRERYRRAVMEFSREEKRRLTAYIEQLHPVLVRQYPSFSEIPWRFLKVSPYIEGGLPHTRGRYIVLSPPYLAYFRQSGNIRLLELLVHEQMHVYQRLFPNKFQVLYEEVWGFTKAEKIRNNPWLTRKQLVNPDGVDCSWLFPLDRERWIWPLIVLSTSDQPQMPRDMKMVAVEMKKTTRGEFYPVTGAEKIPVLEDLLMVSRYREVFPRMANTNIYHPNEACASVFAKIVVLENFEHFMAAEKLQQWRNESIVLRKWFKDLFAK